MKPGKGLIAPISFGVLAPDKTFFKDILVLLAGLVEDNCASLRLIENSVD